MSLTLNLRPVAEEELALAAEWYEQKQVGLDGEFIFSGHLLSVFLSSVRSHKMMVLSLLPEASVLPSGL